MNSLYLFSIAVATMSYPTTSRVEITIKLFSFSFPLLILCCLNRHVHNPLFVVSTVQVCVFSWTKKKLNRDKIILIGHNEAFCINVIAVSCELWAHKKPKQTKRKTIEKHEVKANREKERSRINPTAVNNMYARKMHQLHTHPYTGNRDIEPRAHSSLSLSRSLPFFLCLLSEWRDNLMLNVCDSVLIRNTRKITKLNEPGEKTHSPAVK